MWWEDKFIGKCSPSHRHIVPKRDVNIGNKIKLVESIDVCIFLPHLHVLELGVVYRYSLSRLRWGSRFSRIISFVMEIDMRVKLFKYSPRGVHKMSCLPWKSVQQHTTSVEAKRPDVKKVHLNKKVNGLHVLWIMASSINSRSITLRLVTIAAAGLILVLVHDGSQWVLHG